ANYHDERIRHVANPARTSLVAQRNQAVELARGEWLAMLDADDIAEPHRLATQWEYVQSHPELDVLGSQMLIIGPSSEPLGHRVYPQSHGEIVAAMRRLNPLAQSTVFVRRDRVVGIGGYQYQRYSVAEDYDLWCRLLSAGATFANHPEQLLRYRIQPDQTKSIRLREHILATLDIKQTYWRSQLNFGDRVRLMLERTLLVLPPSFVLWLFTRTQYRKSDRVSARNE
ncbi:MAG TPA: glycosyltransferase, partial [Pirellulaceae bacterium]|nr:glycosyltransferase [Pirellulaceae bacterium]